MAKYFQRTQISLTRFQNVLKKLGRLTTKPNVVETSGKRHLIYDVLKTSYLRCLEEVQFTTSWRRLIYNVFRTSDLWRFEDVWLEDVLRTSDLWRLCVVLKICVVLKTSNLWSLQDVCKTMSVYQCRNDVYTASKEVIFPYFVLSEIFRKF